MRPLFFLLCLRLAICIGGLSAVAGSGPSDRMPLANVHSAIEALVRDHLGENEVTASVLLRAHERFFEQFDPERTYLMQSEIDRFCSASKGAAYAAEWRSGRFDSFDDMCSLIKEAVFRARQFRKSQSWSLADAEAGQRLLVSGAALWPKSLQSLAERQRSAFVLELAAYVEQAYSSEKAAQADLASAAGVVEARMQKKEAPWISIGGASGEKNFFASNIIQAFGASLDAHSAVFNEAEAEKLKEKLSKQTYGSGLFCSISNGKELVVEKIISGSPSTRIGRPLAVGDRVLSINSQTVSSLLADGGDVVFLLGGDRSVPVLRLMVVRSGALEPELVEIHKNTFDLMDGRVDLRQVCLPAGDAYVVALHAFYESLDGRISSERDVQDAFCHIAEMSRKSKKRLLGVVLDLRDNRGGYVSQAVKVAGLFIRTGVVVVAKYSDGTEHLFRDTDSKDLYDGPFVVLTSRLTASAAEIVAEALQDYGVALIVGDEATYGKGSIQMQTATGKGGVESNQASGLSFKLTVGQYYSAVSGKSIQKTGVRSDIVVPSVWHNKKVGEMFLAGAIPAAKPIHPHFHDNLEDLSQSERLWMHRFYTPFIQVPSDRLRTYIPDLAQRSRNRIGQSRLWGCFFRGEMPAEDIQLKEAVAIVADLSQMEGAEVPLLSEKNERNSLIKSGFR